tara:strand:- start:567 stop:890 length:324 start_codon:yes stop_codon:yes gene_type:complete
MSIAQICQRHMPALKTAGRKTEHELVRAVLINRPFHRWDAFLMDVVTHLARSGNTRFTPSHDNLPRIKMIFDMDVEEVSKHLSTTCKVSRDIGDAWCTLLWFDRLGQ